MFFFAFSIFALFIFFSIYAIKKNNCLLKEIKELHDERNKEQERFNNKIVEMRILIEREIDLKNKKIEEEKQNYFLAGIKKGIEINEKNN